VTPENGRRARDRQPPRSVDPSLAPVSSALPSKVESLGLGNYVILESAVPAESYRVVARSATDYERIVVRVAAEAIRRAIDSRLEVNVARCTNRGVPTTEYILCFAKVIPPDGTKDAEFRLNMSRGFWRRLGDRIKRGDSTLLKLLLKTGPAPTPPAPSASAQPPAAPPPAPPAV
jgi:hypothetical protein